MPMRGRNLGVRSVEDGKDRSLSFHKLRAELFETASELSVLSGAKIAIVLESEKWKFSSFGAPAVEPILDAFLSGKKPVEPEVSKEEKSRISNLRKELLKLKKEEAALDKKKKELIALTNKEIEGGSKVIKFMYGKIKVEDFDLNELYELQHELSKIHEVVKHYSSSLPHGNQVGTAGADEGNGLGGINSS